MPQSGDDGFRLMAEFSLDLMCRADLNRVFTYISPSSQRLLGWLPEEMVGRRGDEFIYPEDRALLAKAVGDDRHLVVLRMIRKDGSLAWMENLAQLIRDPETGEGREWIVTMRDITARKELEIELTSLTLTDGLTGLANRRAFDQTLENEWRRAVRDGSQLSLLMLDIDNFKMFNDTYGHQAGDECLRAVANAVRKVVRGTDVTARYGGEEMAVILPGTQPSGARAVAEKVRAAIESLEIEHTYNVDGGGHVTVSVGAATMAAMEPNRLATPQNLVEAADSALYKAKRAGRNRVISALVVEMDDSGD